MNKFHLFRNFEFLQGKTKFITNICVDQESKLLFNSAFKSSIIVLTAHR